MSTRSHGCEVLLAVSALLTASGCGGAGLGGNSTPALTKPDTSISAPPKDETWCGTAGKDLRSAGWTCLEISGGARLGSYGPTQNSLPFGIAACTPEAVLPAGYVEKGQAVGIPIKAYKQSFSHVGSAGLSLRSVSQWLPDVKTTWDKNASLEVRIEFRDVVRDELHDVDAWFLNLRDTIAPEATKRTVFNNCLARLCGAKEHVVVREVLIGKPKVTLSSSAALDVKASVGWELKKASLGAGNNTARDGSFAITMEPTLPVVFAIKTIPARELLSEASCADLACGHNGEVPCNSSQGCEGALVVRDNRCQTVQPEELTRQVMTNFSMAMMDTFQCQYAKLGEGFLNRMCAGDGGVSRVCSPLDLASIYDKPVGDLYDDINRRSVLCDVATTLLNSYATVGAGAAIDCDGLKSWMIRHGSTRQVELVRSFPLQVSLVGTVLSSLRGDAEATLGQIIQGWATDGGASPYFSRAKAFWHGRMTACQQQPCATRLLLTDQLLSANATWHAGAVALAREWFAAFSKNGPLTSGPGCAHGVLEWKSGRWRYDASRTRCDARTFCMEWSHGEDAQLASRQFAEAHLVSDAP